MIWSRMEVDKKDAVDDKENFYKIDYGLFIISLAVVFSKAVIGYWSSLGLSAFDISNSFEKMLMYLLNTLSSVWLSTEWLINPIIIGLMMSFLTWQIMYLDSDVPGHRPPTPFTYKHHPRSEQLKQFHLCYMFAIAVAPFTAVSLIIINYLS